MPTPSPVRHIPYWITYRADLDQTPPGSVIVLPDNNILDGVDGAMLAQRGLAAIIMTADNADYLCHPNLYDTYLAGLQARLVAKGITPVGFMPGEEWWDRCNNPADIMGWPCLAGMDMMARKAFILPRLRVMVQRIKARWPWCPTIGVETKWNEDQGFGPDLWYPDYTTDVLGIDAYLYAHGWPIIGTPPLDGSDSPAMKAKFGGEVAAMLVGWPAYNWKGTLHYNRPVMLVAQAFREENPANTWGTAPTPDQLRWWYDLAQQHPQVVALAWFCQRSAAGILGMDVLPESRAAYDTIWAENQP